MPDIQHQPNTKGIFMVNCQNCGKMIRRDEPVSALFTQDRQRNFIHRICEEKTDYFAKWKEEAAWAFKPARMTVAEWHHCSPHKHLGVWQSMFIARRDEDIWCPDCGLKIARYENLTCPSCNGPAVILNCETTRMLFTHGEHLYKILLHCTERGEETHSYAVISGFTPVAITFKKKHEEVRESHSQTMLLQYRPKGDPRKGLTV